MANGKAKTVWIVPHKCCDTCGTKIGNKFYDARTSLGPWAIMCPSCHHLGPGLGRLGTGYGQEYTKIEGGDRYEKTGG